MDKHPLKADSGDRNSDRRHREDRRKTYTDPKDLPFPDRRKGDRRQMDRRVVSDEEKSEILSRVVPSSGPSSKKPSEYTV
jgi:hypothetical protein